MLIARNNTPTLAPALKESIVIGLALTVPLTLLTTGFLSSADNHWVGGELTDANGLFLMGWARDGGDLRVAHFFGTHALHVIPAFGLAATYALGGKARIAVRIFAAAFVVLVCFTLVQALMGHPFLPVLG